MTVTRRRFLAGAATGAAALRSIDAFGFSNASGRLNLAVFGTMYNAAHFLTASHIYGASVVALCDPDERNIAKAFQGWKETATRLEANESPQDRKWAKRYHRLAEGKDIKIYSDIRRLFDDLTDSIDALVVSHYDHLHAVACSRALRAGKPVCSERPLGLNIAEARRLRELAAESQLATVYRSPGTGHGAFRRAVELVDEGAIGDVKEVHIWFRRGGPDRDSLPRG